MCRPRGDSGNVAEFSLVAVLLVAIFLVVLQVGIYIHERNVMAASVQAAARYAANANVTSLAGGQRATKLISEALSEQAASGLTCTVDEEVGDGGLIVVVVRCVGSIPTVVTAVGNVLPIDVTGRAVKEGAQ
ncbi:TadE-like protein [Antricoccus suffuscus]|uniref:TadE-like protein n=1 Tax=Antricoccus suffuscus TaxID=1629062 RepID=A0A2T0ZYD6_9ACTN|nr:TadE/TadG family type IV pilus assembly protein [Antricoccus suffuscus]PRZ41098.1 TadE-like protein [Antricoccus suffuscus]